MTPPTLTSHASHVILSLRHSRIATIAVSRFANHVQKSPNLTLIKIFPSKNLVSTSFAPTVGMTLDRPNVRYSPIALPKPLPLAPLPYIIIIPLNLHPTYLHNPLILHLHRTPHHPTHHPKPYPSHPPNSPTVPTIPNIPTRLSPVKRSQSITSIAKPPLFNNPHRSFIPPLLPPNLIKLHGK